MAKPPHATVEHALLDRHGQTYAEELGIDLSRGLPSALFRLLCAAVLFSARIGAKQGVSAARALFDQGWTTADKLAATTWEERVGVDIFFREVQVAWEELFPFADRRALEQAERLGLPGDARALARGHDRRTFARLVAALVRSALAKDTDAVLETARSG